MITSLREDLTAFSVRQDDDLASTYVKYSSGFDKLRLGMAKDILASRANKKPLVFGCMARLIWVKLMLCVI